MTRDTIVEAALRLARGGFNAVTCESVAAALGTSIASVHEVAPTDSDLRIMAMVALNTRPIAPVSAAVEKATSPEEAVHVFLTEYVRTLGADMDLCRAMFLDQRTLSFDFSKEQLARLYPLNDQLFGPVAAKLQAHWGSDELMHGIHPRRLIFTGHLATLGLLAMKSIAELSNDPLKHSDEELVAELSGALAAPTTMMNQVVALNEASARLAELRTQAEVVAQVPSLLTEHLGFIRGALQIDATPSTEAGELVVAVTHGDERLGSLIVKAERLDKRDHARLEMFANMVGLALDNVRFYESLNALVEQRTSELRQAQAALVQSEKMASMGQLVAGVAHELNTPLGALQSAQDSLATAVRRVEETLRTEAPELLEQHKKLRNALRVLSGSASVIETGCERVGAVVDRLERFAQLDRAERAQVDVHQCIDDAVAALPPSRAEVRIERDFAQATELLCWPAKLNQLFLTVLLNAVQAMPSGGVIRITTERDDDELCITIEDNGTGIDPAHLEKIFDPGFTTKGVGVGTGLGLSIAYQIVRGHGGEISATSVLGEGTMLRMTLPL